MREIVLDTETTGLDADNGDRIVDIGCVELENHQPTGKTFQVYINPMRSISEEVVQIHGLTEEFLSDKPIFEEIADDFLAFVGENTPLVIHNAAFDIKFLNYELQACNKPILSENRVIDTLLIARKKFPGAKNNLDALCKRYEVDPSRRTVHGALLDSELLAEVYLELITTRELNFSKNEKNNKNQQLILNTQNVSRETFPYRTWKISENEMQYESCRFVFCEFRVSSCQDLSPRCRPVCRAERRQESRRHWLRNGLDSRRSSFLSRVRALAVSRRVGLGRLTSVSSGRSAESLVSSTVTSVRITMISDIGNDRRRVIIGLRARV